MFLSFKISYVTCLCDKTFSLNKSKITTVNSFFPQDSNQSPVRKQFEMFYLFQMLSPTWCTNLLSKLSNLDLRYASSVHQRALHLQKFPGQKMAWSFQAPRGNLKFFWFYGKKNKVTTSITAKVKQSVLQMNIYKNKITTHNILKIKSFKQKNLSKSIHYFFYFMHNTDILTF